MMLVWLLAGLCLSVASLGYLLGALLAVARYNPSARRGGATLPPVTILKPLCGDEPALYENLASFALEGLTPVWRWTLGDAVLEQRVTMVHGENTTVVTFTVVRASSRVTLALKPLCTYRDYHSHAHGGWSLDAEVEPGGCRAISMAASTVTDGTVFLKEPLALRQHRGRSW